jgi:hypothetical protein
MHMPMLAVVSVPNGQGLKQIGELALAFGLCALIGLEREWRMKSAACARTRWSASALRCS